MRTNAINSVQPHRPLRTAAKVIAGTAAVAAATTGTVLVLAKRGKLNPKDGNKYVEQVKAFLLKRSNKFFESKTGERALSVYRSVRGFVKGIPSKISDAIQSVKDKCSSKGAKEAVEGYTEQL